MKFKLYEFCGNTDSLLPEKELFVLRIGDRWLFEAAYYVAFFQSWGVDFTFSPRIPLFDLGTVRAYWGRHSLYFSLFPKHREWDDIIDADWGGPSEINLDEGSKNEGA